MDAMTLSFRTEVSISSGENVLAKVETLSENSEISLFIVPVSASLNANSFR